MISEVKDTVNKNANGIEEMNIAISEMKEDINFIASKTIRNDSKIDKIDEKLKSVK